MKIDETKFIEKNVELAILDLKAVQEDEESAIKDNQDVRSEGNSTKMIDEISYGTKKIDNT